MVKFCGVCGSPLDENGICPECDPVKSASVRHKNLTEKTESPAAAPAHSTDETVKAVGDSAAAPSNIIYLNYRPDESANAQKAKSTGSAKKKNSKSLIPFAAILLALCILGGCLVAAFCFDWFGFGAKKNKDANTQSSVADRAESAVVQQPGAEITFELDESYKKSQGQAVASTAYGCFMNDINLSLIGAETVSEELVSLKDEDGAKMNALCRNASFCGNEFFAFDKGGDLRRLTVTGNTVVKNEGFFSAEELKESALGYFGDSGETYARDLTDFTVDGDDVFARVEGSFEYANEHKSLNNRLVHFGSDGSIKLVGDEDVCAVSFAVSDGWIYYADNGYEYDIARNEYRYNSNRVGIYKIRTDGTEKTLLKDSFNEYAIEDTEPHFGCAGNLSLCGGKLYYISLTDGENTFLYRMDSDGANDERLAEVSVDNYAADTSNNTVYVRTGTFGTDPSGVQNLYRIDLNNKSNQMMTELQGSTYYMTVANGYLYVYDDHRDFRNKCLKRIDLKDDTVQFLFCRTFEKTDKDGDSGIEKRVEEKSPEYTWLDYKDNSPL